MPGTIDAGAPSASALAGGTSGDVFSADHEEDLGAATSPGIVPGASASVFEPSTPRAAPVPRGVSIALDDDDDIDRQEVPTTAVAGAGGLPDAIAESDSTAWAPKEKKSGKRGLLIAVGAVAFFGIVIFAAAAAVLGPRILAALNGPVATPTSMVATTPGGTTVVEPTAVVAETPVVAETALASTTPDAIPTEAPIVEQTPEPRPTRAAVAIAATPTPRPRVTATPKPRGTPKPRATAKPRATPRPQVSAGDLEFMTTKADVLVVEGKMAAAKKQYEKVIALDRRYGPAHLGLARTLEAMGDVKGACREWRTYLQVAPAGKGAVLAGKKAAACK